MFENKTVLCFRAAGCCVPCVLIFWNKGVTKEGNDDFPSCFVSHITGMLSGTHCSSGSFFFFFKSFLLLGFECVWLAQLSSLGLYKRSRVLMSACILIFQIIYDAFRNKEEVLPFN